MTLMYESLALLAAFVLFYSLVAKGVERSWVSGPIVFTTFGLLIGPVGLDLLSFETGRETLKTLAELTPALVLFTDAAGADLGVLRRTARLPARWRGSTGRCCCGRPRASGTPSRWSPGSSSVRR